MTNGSLCQPKMETAQNRRKPGLNFAQLGIVYFERAILQMAVQSAQYTISRILSSCAPKPGAVD